MKLLLAASAPLRPYLERMLPASPHRIDPVYLPAAPDNQTLGGLIADAADYDALLLADGEVWLPEDGAPIASCARPIILPRVHSAASLLLGPARYRRLFRRFDGGVCWRLPICTEPLFDSARGDCMCLCYLADTSLGLPDESLAARAAAQENGWDFFEEESDLSLLARLLAGAWDSDAFDSFGAAHDRA